MSLLDIVRHNRLTLLQPTQWYDQNDTFGLNQYSLRMGAGSVYALCLAEGAEQAHHWQIFAGHSHGLCIQFDRDEFINLVEEPSLSLLHGPVIYESLSEVRARKPIALQTLPFLKRDTFKAEQEYRVVAWQDDLVADDTYQIPMPANMIQRVTFGPSMPVVLGKTIKDITCEQKGCERIPFSISRMVNNASWAAAISEGLPEARNAFFKNLEAADIPGLLEKFNLSLTGGLNPKN